MAGTKLLANSPDTSSGETVISSNASGASAASISRHPLIGTTKTSSNANSSASTSASKVEFSIKTQLIDPLSLLLGLAFLSVIALMIWQAQRMQTELVLSTALRQASNLRDTIVTFRSTYSSDIVDRVNAAGGIVSHDFKNIEGAIPIPATLTILLGEKLSQDSSKGSFRLYSDYPFPWRNDSGAKDSFEAEALAAVRQNPSEPFYRIENLNGQTVFRYAHADIMENSCVNCHNSRADSPRTDWKVGDVRGVMAINLPISSVSDQANASLQTIIGLILAVAALAFFTLLSFLRKTRQTNIAILARHKQEREAERRLQEEKISSQEKSLVQAQHLQESVAKFLDVTMEIASGDFSKRGEVTDDELGNVANAINLMVEDLSGLLAELKSSAESVTVGSEVMTQTTSSIVKSSKQQSYVADKTHQKIEQVSKTTQALAQRASAAANAAVLTLAASDKGHKAVQDTLLGMQAIREDVTVVAEQMQALSQRSDEISRVIDSVNHIASQINLLALSAALEAAGAGEAGKRFALVAEEVGRLAKESTESGEHITRIISEIRKEIAQVLVTTQNSKKQVNAGYQVATEAGKRLEDIGGIAKQSAQLAQFISKASEAQLQGIAGVSKALALMHTISQSSAQTVGQGSEAAEQLKQLAHQLSQSLERFRLS